MLQRDVVHLDGGGRSLVLSYVSSVGEIKKAEREEKKHGKDWEEDQNLLNHIPRLAADMDLPLTEARDHFEAQGARDGLVETSGQLRVVAGSHRAHEATDRDRTALLDRGQVRRERHERLLKIDLGHAVARVGRGAHEPGGQDLRARLPDDREPGGGGGPRAGGLRPGLQGDRLLPRRLEALDLDLPDRGEPL